MGLIIANTISVVDNERPVPFLARQVPHQLRIFLLYVI